MSHSTLADLMPTQGFANSTFAGATTPAAPQPWMQTLQSFGVAAPAAAAAAAGCYRGPDGLMYTQATGACPIPVSVCPGGAAPVPVARSLATAIAEHDVLAVGERLACELRGGVWRSALPGACATCSIGGGGGGNTPGQVTAHAWLGVVAVIVLIVLIICCCSRSVHRRRAAAALDY